MSAPVESWAWPEGIPRDHWGRVGWRWAHSMAIEYPDEPTKSDRELAARRISGFFAGLPCPTCRAATAEYCRANPPDLANSEALQSWWREMHNWKNRELGKPELTYEAYVDLYGDYIANCRALPRGAPSY